MIDRIQNQIATIAAVLATQNKFTARQAELEVEVSALIECGTFEIDAATINAHSTALHGIALARELAPRLRSTVRATYLAAMATAAEAKRDVHHRHLQITKLIEDSIRAQLPEGVSGVTFNLHQSAAFKAELAARWNPGEGFGVVDENADFDRFKVALTYTSDFLANLAREIVRCDNVIASLEQKAA